MRKNFFLLIVPLTLCSMHPINSNTHRKHAPDGTKDYPTAVLKYSGTIEGYANVNVGIRVVLDTSIGLRYEVTYSGPVTSHVAIFYKFDKPYQTIFYNYLKHTSKVIKKEGSANEPDVSIIGKETISNYACTHLQHSNENETQDYWMSTSVPGFKQVSNVLNRIDASLKIMVINQSIFNWGGLVKLKMKAVEKGGQSTTFTLNLVSAQAGIPVNLAEFEVPTN